MTPRRTSPSAGKLELQLRHAQKMEAIGGLAEGVAQISQWPHDYRRCTANWPWPSSLTTIPQTGPTRGIRRAASRAESVTRKLLAFSRQQHLFESQNFDLNDLVNAIARLLERMLGDISRCGRACPRGCRLSWAIAARSNRRLSILRSTRAMRCRGAAISSSAPLSNTSTKRRHALHAPMPPGRYVVLWSPTRAMASTARRRRESSSPFSRPRRSARAPDSVSPWSGGP